MQHSTKRPHAVEPLTPGTKSRPSPQQMLPISSTPSGPSNHLGGGASSSSQSQTQNAPTTRPQTSTVAAKSSPNKRKKDPEEDDIPDFEDEAEDIPFCWSNKACGVTLYNQ